MRRSRPTGVTDVTVTVDSPNYRVGSAGRLKTWDVRLGGVDEQAAATAFSANMENDLEQTPMFPMANKIGGRVSANMQAKAMEAIFFSLMGTTIYLWLRFQKVIYGLAAAVGADSRRAGHDRHDRASAPTS